MFAETFAGTAHQKLPMLTEMFEVYAPWRLLMFTEMSAVEAGVRT